MSGKREPSIRGTYGTMYYVKDMAKSSQFYKETLALTPRFESPEWTEFDVKGHGVLLHAMNDGKPGHEQGVLVLDVTGITQMVQDLKKKGVEFLGEIKEVHPGAYCCDFRDPSGNIVSLFEDTTR